MGSRLGVFEMGIKLAEVLGDPGTLFSEFEQMLKVCRASVR